IGASSTVAVAGADGRSWRGTGSRLASAAARDPAGRGRAMSVGFRAVQWNRAKIVYDSILVTAVALFIGVFLLIAYRLAPPQDLPAAMDLRIRAFGSCPFVMLTVILSIGPLARLARRFLPLLYNRRHFGVLTFVIASLHVWFMLEWYAVQGALPNLVTELTTWADYGKFIGFPFKVLGITALVVLFLMPAASHDFLLMFLPPRAWKALHMALYVAYGLVVLHVALGIMQYVHTALIPAMLFGGFGIVAALHLLAAWRERERANLLAADGWIAVGAPASIPDKGARIVAAPGGERIAGFRDGAGIGALANPCAQQNRHIRD